MVASDEQPLKARLDKIPRSSPPSAKDGTVTAANSSSISDGAAALVLMRRREAERRGLKPLADDRRRTRRTPRQPGMVHHRAGRRHQEAARAGRLERSDVDLYEINEAFAVVTMAAMRDLGLPHEKVNVHGGACALGHPIGASGARILVTLLARAGEVRPKARRRVAVHRRRRGDSHGDRAPALTGSGTWH